MATQSTFGLLRLTGFRALFLAQLLGAFNDNVLKVLVSLLAIETAALGHSAGYLSLVSAVFMAPYLLFSGYAGYVADICNKRRVLIAVKAGEVAIMVLAFAALIWSRIDLLLVVMFLLGTQSTFFSPAKYGIVPEMLPEDALSSANGWLELSRYTAVILGTAMGGVVLLQCGDRPAIMGLMLLAIAAAGFAASLRITPVRRSGAEKEFRLNPWCEVATGVRRLAGDPRLSWTVAGISFFEFMGSLILLDLLLVGKETMGLDDGWTSLLAAFAGLGIGIGSVVAGRLSRGRVEIGLVPFGAAGLGAAVVALPLAAASFASMSIMLLMVGIAGGLVIVPLYSALQKLAGDDERGHLVSTNNFLNMTAVVLSAGVLWLLRDVFSLAPARILQVAGVLTLTTTLCATRWSPDYATSAMRWARTSLGSLAPLALALIALPFAARDRHRQEANRREEVMTTSVSSAAPAKIGQTQKIKFREGNHAGFYRALKLRVNAYFDASGKTRYADRRLWFKAVLFTVITVGAYALILSNLVGPWGMLILANIYGIGALMLGINVAHDAAHDALTPWRWFNRIVQTIVFTLIGANAYLWRLRHIKSHHTFPNVIGCDIDIDQNLFLRMSPNHRRRWFHRFQHLYAPVIFWLVDVHTVFYEDFEYLFKRRLANMMGIRHPNSEYVMFVLCKIAYIAIVAGIPMAVLDLPWWQVLLGAATMSFVSSIVFVTLLIGTHFAEEAEFPHFDRDGCIAHDWAEHAMVTSVDWSPESELASFVTGGANCHAAHHLFPTVSHVHYIAITRIIRATAQEFGVRYNRTSLPGLVRSHFRFLRRMGRVAAVA